MKIYTNKKVKEMEEMLSQIKASIIKLKGKYIELYAENVKLRAENANLRTIINSEFPNYDIDFPNSEKGGKANPDRPDNCPDFSDF